MIACVQRVSKASVSTPDGYFASIEKGLLVLVCALEGDGEAQSGLLARKCCGLRIFSDGAGKMNRSCADAGGAVLVVSNFTLAADCKKGRRPSFEKAMDYGGAMALTEHFAAECAKTGLEVKTGVFGGDMEVSLVNDGPVTILLDTEKL